MARIQGSWKFLRYESPNLLLEALDRGEVNPAEVSSIFIVDKYYDPQHRDVDFEKFASTMAPHCFFGVVSYDEDLQKPILSAVEDAAASSNSPAGTVYFIDSQSPSASLRGKVKEFIESNIGLEGNPLSEVARRLRQA